MGGVGAREPAGGGQVGVDEIAGVLAAVEGEHRPVEPAALQDRTELSQTKLTTAISRLEEAGALQVLPSGEVAEADDGPDHAEAVRAAAEAEEKRRAFDRSRVEMMRGYADASGCRRAFVLSYFGEPFAPPCGRCDNCDAGHGAAAAVEEPFPLGTRVAHEEWGEGVVQRYEGDKMVVLFDEVGYKSLALEVVRERGLLDPA